MNTIDLNRRTTAARSCGASDYGTPTSWRDAFNFYGADARLWAALVVTVAFGLIRVGLALGGSL